MPRPSLPVMAVVALSLIACAVMSTPSPAITPSHFEGLASDGMTHRGFFSVPDLFHQVFEGENGHSVVFDDPSDFSFDDFMDFNDLTHDIFETDEGGDWYEFLPRYVGSAIPGQAAATWEGKCFKKSSATVTMDPQGKGATIEFELAEPESMFCTDYYLVGTVEDFYLKSFFTHGKHTVHIAKFKDFQQDDVTQNGYRIFLVKDSILKTLKELYETFKLFDSWKLQQENVKFLKEAMGLDLASMPRTAGAIKLDESHIHSGDQIVITRLDGLDPLIMWGTGSHTGHTAVCLWVGDELYVLESTDKNPFGKSFWPPPYGIIHTPYKQWLDQAEAADMVAAIIPLKEEYRNQFDEKAAWEWFQTVEGMPYGYHNFLFGWIDTPRGNFPPQLDEHLLPVAFSIVESIAPSVADKMWNLALNHRLGTEGLKLAELLSEARKKGMGFGDLISLPEKDEWTYPDGKSMVCNVFVQSLYMAGGLLKEFDIQATEFTPKDLYQLDLYDPDYKWPEECNYDDLPYCQILGKYKLTLPEFSSIKPYDKMNENCPAQPKDYIRPDGC